MFCKYIYFGTGLLGLTTTFLFISCARNPVKPVSIAVNPYDFRSVDVEFAQLSLAQAIQVRDALDSIGVLRSNPYQFDQNKIHVADSLLQQAISVETTLQKMLNKKDFTDLEKFIPDSTQVTTGRTYWLTQRIQVDTATKPYWRDQRRLAGLSKHQEWIDFCEHMLRNIDLQIELIDTTLGGLNCDEAILRRHSTESATQIVKRKIALEHLRIEYHTDLISVLNQAIELEIPDWTGLANFIPAPQQIEQGRSYWIAEIDSIQISRIPYWENQGEKAVTQQNQFWIDFCKRVVENLNLYFDLANQILSNLELDLAFINQESSETPEEIVGRKKNLALEQIRYYQDLIKVLNEGMALGFLVEE